MGGHPDNVTNSLPDEACGFPCVEASSRSGQRQVYQQDEGSSSRESSFCGETLIPEHFGQAITATARYAACNDEKSSGTGHD